MKYRVTCLTPTLVGDGQRLSPIDYMVWRDHINVLDQRRIFKILAKGPRLDGYLAQLKKAEKLDFASWGGFAQNYAGRRIPFEHASSIALWERAYADDLFIPTFATGASGPYLPGTAIKGALRTGAVFDRWSEATIRDLAERAGGERIPRYITSKAEESVLGGAGANRVKRVAPSDSGVVEYGGMKVYLMRVATLVAKQASRPAPAARGPVRGPAQGLLAESLMAHGFKPSVAPGVVAPSTGDNKFELGWKSARGTVEARRVDESTPMFVEMAAPGTAFEGAWREKSAQDRAKLFQPANRYAEELIARHKDYAARTGLTRLSDTLAKLETSLDGARRQGNGCVLSIGWGGGLLGKAAYLNTEDEFYRKILRSLPLYQRAIQTGMPFPKTRRVVFEQGQPASLPGWVLLEVV